MAIQEKSSVVRNGITRSIETKCWNTEHGTVRSSPWVSICP